MRVKILFAALMLAFALLSSESYADLNTLKEAYWKLDEGTGAVANNSLGNWKNGTINGSATWNTSGRFNTAINFDGTNDFISFGSQPVAANGTISAWVWADTQQSGTNFIFSNVNPAQTTGVALSINSTGYIRFVMDNTTERIMASNTSITLSSWNHLAVTWKNGEQKMYLNNLIVNTSTYTSAPDTTSSLMCVGGNPVASACANAMFKGVIDDINLWNRSLTEAEIESVYSENMSRIYAYDEKTLSPINFNFTLYNATETETVTQSANKYFWITGSSPVGDVTFIPASNGYTNRKYYNMSYPPVNYNITAYLLPTTQGQTVRFHIVTVSDKPIESVLSDAKLLIGGTYTTVEQISSDSSGTSTFFLDPTATYQLSFTHPSYTTSLLSILPSQQDYKITMTGTNNFLNRTFNYGDVTVRLTPTGTSLLRHSPGNTTLNYTVTAPSGDLDGYGWMVKYNGTTLYSKSVSAFPYGGTDSYFLNTSNLSGMLYVDMYYTKYGNTTWFTNIYTMNNITLGNNTLSDIISNFGNTGTGGYGFKKTTLALLGFVAIILIMSFVSQFAVAGAGIIGWMGLAFMWYAGLISASLLWLVGLSVIAVLVIRGGFN